MFDFQQTLTAVAAHHASRRTSRSPTGELLCANCGVGRAAKAGADTAGALPGRSARAEGNILHRASFSRPGRWGTQTRR